MCFFSLHFFNNRFRQTTVGALLALAAKEELGADVCAINGAPVKGNRAYTDGVITFRQLKQVVKHHTVITATIMIYFVLNDVKNNWSTFLGNISFFFFLICLLFFSEPSVNIVATFSAVVTQN